MRWRELIIALAVAWPIAANGQSDVRALRSQILLMQAEGIADRLAQFIKETQSRVGWTTQLPPTGASIEQRRFDAQRLLRQAPAVTELSLLDAQGKELYKISRLALDVVGSGTDYSKEAKFTETMAHLTWRAIWPAPGQGHGACAWGTFTLSSPNSGKDRALAQDSEEPHPTQKLLPAWRSRTAD
jgi:hypothetical protein